MIDNDVYRTLLESTRAIPWKIDWASARFAYIGPQIEALLGWTPESWRTVDDWAARMHPEDRAWVVDYCVSQSQAGVDHEADYRALSAGGEYVWIRDVVHVVRHEAGVVQSLIGFMFDISARKKSEERLLEMQRQPRDLLARFGGEEFVLVLPATDEAAARHVSEHCRQAIFKAQIPHAASAVGQLLTVSQGVGTVIPSSADTLIGFIDAVDRRLYRAKQAGRDRSVAGAA